MNSSRNRWIRGVGAVALVGALLVTSVVVADDDNGKGKNPFTQILAKLDQILGKLNGSDNGNHTLRWDTNHPSASRFTTAFTGAVLDKNTGLVWEQAPDATGRSRSDSVFYCVSKNINGTRGWRLPSVPELTSLIDPSLPAPFVPASVFTGVQSANYWSATTVADSINSGNAWFVHLDNGLAAYDNEAVLDRAWCVRGDMNADQY
jgi:hypothetical protein